MFVFRSYQVWLHLGKVIYDALDEAIQLNLQPSSSETSKGIAIRVM
jgi:hypothetical protein